MDKYYTLDNDPDFSNCKNHDSTISQLLIKIRQSITLNKLSNSVRRQQTILFNSFGNYRKGYLRIKLPNNDSETIVNAIKVFKNMIVKFGDDMCNNIFNVNLLLNLHICSYVGQKVEIIDVEQFLSQHTDEEINSLIRYERNRSVIYNSKFIFADKKAFYLDIPLCDGFYCNHEDYVGKKSVTVNYFHNLNEITLEKDYPFTIEFEENICKTKIRMFKECIFNTPICIQYTIIDSIANIEMNLWKCKFIFIIIDKVDHVVELLNVTLDTKDENNINKQYEILTHNIIMINCIDKIIYGFNPSKNNNMDELYNDKCTKQSYDDIDLGLIKNINLTFNTIAKPIKIQLICVSTFMTFY
jgi:hypothetical protein